MSPISGAVLDGHSMANVFGAAGASLADYQHRNNTYAIGCATLALGSFMLIPFALKYGLRPIYVLSSAAQMAIMIWAARTVTAGDWWGVNALQCWVGSLAETMVQMTVADVFFVHQRGMMNSIYIWASNFGSSLAPVAAGFVTASQGWRWVWWWMAIFFGVVLVAFIFGFEESKFDWTAAVIHGVPPSPDVASIKSDAEGQADKQQPALDPEKAAPSDLSPDEEPMTTVQIDPSIPRKTYWQRLSLATTTPGPFMLFARHAYQPFQILFTIPGVAYMSLVYAVLLAWSTVMSAALSTYMILPPYDFNSTQIGLMNLAPFIGNTLGSLICGPLSDWTILRLAKRNDGIYEPEMRLWVFVPFIPFQVAGAFWFGKNLLTVSLLCTRDPQIHIQLERLSLVSMQMPGGLSGDALAYLRAASPTIKAKHYAQCLLPCGSRFTDDMDRLRPAGRSVLGRCSLRLRYMQLRVRADLEHCFDIHDGCLQ